MLVQLRIAGPPAKGDVLGVRWLDSELAPHNPGPEWVDVDEVVGENGDGTLDLRLGDPSKAGVILSGVAEGDAVGEFRRVSGLRHGDLRAIRQALAPLLQDGDAAVQTAAQTVAALFGRGGRRQSAQALVAAATNTGLKPGPRVQALTLLAVLLAQEIDR